MGAAPGGGGVIIRPPTPGSLSFNTAGDAWQVSSALARVHLSEKYTHWQCNCMRRCRQPSVRGSRRAAQALQEMYPWYRGKWPENRGL